MKSMLASILLSVVCLFAGVAKGDDDCDVCKVSVKPLDLSRTPTTPELIRSGQFGGALSPTFTRTPSPDADLLLFGQAMNAWNGHDYPNAVASFKRHIREFPQSAWRAEAELHLGCEARFNGRYAEAEKYFKKIVAEYGDRVDSSGDIACKAKLRLAMLEFMRGDFGRAETMWSTMVARDPDRRRRDHARHWLMRSTLYRSEAKWVRRCAMESLAYLLKVSGKAEDAESLTFIPANPAYGFRADELAQLSGENGVPLTGIRAANPDVLPTPFIAHYGFNHFVTVTSRDRAGNLTLFDPILNHVVVMTPDQFGQEWSGLALVPTQAWPDTRLTQATGTTVLSLAALADFAGGCCGVENVNQDEGCIVGVGMANNKVGGDIAANGGGGWMPVWGFTPQSMNLFIKDTPIFYQPAVGPAIAFTMVYNSIDADTSLPSFGEKWFFAYHSYIIETPASGAGTVTVFMPDGRNDVFSPIAGTNTYTAPARVFNKLTKITTNRYSLSYPDGTAWQFGAPLGATNVQQALLSQIADRHSNTVNLLYDGQSDPKLTAVVDALSQTSRLYYADSGLITNITDPFGRSAMFTYSPTLHLTSVTDMGGVTSPYEFYESGEAEDYVKSIRTRSGPVTFTNQFQNEGNMWMRRRITATYTNGTTEVLYFNGGEDGNPSTFFTDRNGQTTRYKLGINVAFPFQGSIVWERAPDGNQVSYLYNTALQPTNVTDEAGQSWTFAYNSVGRLSQLRQPNGYQTAFAYTNGNYDLYQVTENSTNRLLTLGYTTNRDVAWASNALGQVTQFRYDSQGRLTNGVDALGVTDLYEYGADQRLASVKRAGMTLATLQYDAAGRVTNAAGPDGIAVSAAYDNLNRLTSLSLPGESPYLSLFQTNSLLLSAQTDRSGRQSLFTYNALNLLTQVKGPDYSITRFEYDPNENLTALVDAQVHKTRFTYDSRERPTAKTYSDGVSNTVAWTSRSLIDKTVSPRGITNSFLYDASGLLTNLAYSGSTNTTAVRLTYDSANRLSTLKDGWSTNSFTYDLLGRVTQYREVQGTFTQKFDYAWDVIGRVTSVVWQAGTNAACITSYRFDTLNRITNIVSDAGTFGYAYLSNGLPVKTLTYPNGETANSAFDGLMRLTNLLYKTSGGSADGQWAYGYDHRDQVTSRTDPSTNVYAYRYDEVGRMVEATGVKGTNTTGGYPFRYTYDRVGNRTRQTEGTQQRTFTYNANNQALSVGRSNQASVAGYVSEAGTGTVVEARATTTGAWQRIATRYISQTQGWFDATLTLTNATGTNTVWIRATDKSGNASTQTVQVVNSATNLTFRYDLDGNQTNLLAGTGEWDAENRLVRIAYGTNASTRLKYDGAGRLREIAECNSSGTATNTVRYAWNGMLPWAELDGSNKILRTFTWGLDLSGSVGGAGGIGGLVGMRSRQGASTNYLVRTDAKGNVTEIRQTNGTVVAAYSFAPFGYVITNTGSYSQPFRFQSKLYHAKSGLGYWGARWYDYKTGRWISRDGLGEASDINLYEYCGGAPLTMSDPFGLWVWHAVGAAAGGLLDLGFQLGVQDKCIGDVNWVSVGASAASGALGVGLGNAVARIVGMTTLEGAAAISARAVLNSAGSAAIGASGRVAQNAINGDPLGQGSGRAALWGAGLGGVGSLGTDIIPMGIGAYLNQGGINAGPVTSALASRLAGFDGTWSTPLAPGPITMGGVNVLVNVIGNLPDPQSSQSRYP